jgi:type IV pilus assembly protein PilC
MAVFIWEGRTRQGSIKKGTMEAPDSEAVMAQLRAQMIVPINVKAKAKDVMEYLPFLKKGIKTKSLVIFTRQFAVMIDAGLPLVQCLDLLAEQEPNQTFQEVLRAVKADVEQGATFAESLRKHPKPFDALYVNLVQAGEVGGILDTILNRLAAYLEKADALKRKVKGAMTYPITVMVVAIGVLGLLLVKVIPVFEKMFADFGGTLPAPTQMVVSLSNFLQEWIVVILVSAAAVMVCFFQARSRSKKFCFRTDAIALKLPVFGSLLRKVAVARFTRTLGTMISSGVPILDALDICSRTSGNMVLEAALQKTRAAIAEGKTIAEPLTQTKVFPQMVVQMIGVGEQTGAMDSMLTKIADFYDDEVDVAVEGSIGAILIAMYLPIFKIAEAVK